MSFKMDYDKSLPTGIRFTYEDLFGVLENRVSYDDDMRIIKSKTKSMQEFLDKVNLKLEKISDGEVGTNWRVIDDAISYTVNSLK